MTKYVRSRQQPLARGHRYLKNRLKMGIIDRFSNNRSCRQDKLAKESAKAAERAIKKAQKEQRKQEKKPSKNKVQPKKVKGDAIHKTSAAKAGKEVVEDIKSQVDVEFSGPSCENIKSQINPEVTESRADKKSHAEIESAESRAPSVESFGFLADKPDPHDIYANADTLSDQVKIFFDCPSPDHYRKEVAHLAPAYTAADDIQPRPRSIFDSCHEGGTSCFGNRFMEAPEKPEKCVIRRQYQLGQQASGEESEVVFWFRYVPKVRAVDDFSWL